MQTLIVNTLHRQAGRRVLTLAWRMHPPGVHDAALHAMSQSDAEQGVALCGLAVLLNPMRADTPAVLTTLQVRARLPMRQPTPQQHTVCLLVCPQGASVRCLMVTGDHLQTALSVAHACGMLPASQPTVLLDTNADNQLQGRLLQPNGGALPLSPAALQDAMQNETDALPMAVTGPAWHLLSADAGAGGDAGARAVLWQVVARGVVFARMAPEDKRQVVEALSLGLTGGGGGDKPCATTMVYKVDHDFEANFHHAAITMRLLLLYVPVWYGCCCICLKCCQHRTPLGQHLSRRPMCGVLRRRSQRHGCSQGCSGWHLLV